MSENGADRNGFVPREVEVWPDAVDGSVLLDGLVGEISRYAVLPKYAPEALALFVVHTYGYELREVSTYIAVESPEKQCGKTTLLAVLSEMVNRPVVSSNISPPAFFRVIEEFRPTLLIDEADTYLRGNDELRGILNAGYTKKTAFVVRVANEKIRSSNSETRNKLQSEMIESSNGSPELNSNRRPTLARFSSWCPKVIAAIGRLPDTLADRCIVVRMQRKTAAEQCARVRDLDGEVLRRQCARFVRDHRGEISGATPSVPKGLNDRAADIWEPLLAIAELAGEEWAKKAREAAEALTSAAQENNPASSLFMDIMLVFAAAKSDRVFSRELTQQLNEFRERPWQNLCRGRVMNEAWLAHYLRPYGVVTRTVRAGDLRAKGYYLDDFKDVFKRYLPKSEL
jgi:hypothetical protein